MQRQGGRKPEDPCPTSPLSNTHAPIKTLICWLGFLKGFVESAAGCRQQRGITEPPAYAMCSYAPGNRKQRFLPRQFPQTRYCWYPGVTERSISPRRLALPTPAPTAAGTLRQSQAARTPAHARNCLFLPQNSHGWRQHAGLPEQEHSPASRELRGRGGGTARAAWEHRAPHRRNAPAKGAQPPRCWSCPSSSRSLVSSH